MRNVPKIVVKRLHSLPAESHPDADLLTAFAERSLSGHERESVLQHLAHCGDCREVVALASPATEAAGIATSGSPSRTAWLSLPVLRWGIVAAGVLAVTSVGILQYKQRHQEKTVATNLVAQNRLADAATQSPLPSSPPSTSKTVLPPAEMEKQPEARKEAVAHTQGAGAADKKAVSATGTFPPSQVLGGTGSDAGTGRSATVAPMNGHVQDRVTRRDFALQPAPQSLAPAATAKQNAAPLTTRSTVEVSGAAPIDEVQPEPAPVATQPSAQNQGGQNQIAQNRTGDQLLQNEPSGRVGKAKPALEQAAPGSMAPSSMLDAISSVVKDASGPRWTISANGKLQRSLDGGKTWLDVNIALDDSANANLGGPSQSEVSTVDARSQTSQTKTVAKTKAEAKSRSNASSAAKSAYAPAPPSASTIFRALSVSSNAADVWAGGSGAALYHTLDAGNLWVRVLPSANNIVLTGDIISILFPDPRNGTVTTSNAEVWTTNDGGQTWLKQQ